MRKIGIDFHGVIDKDPEFFKLFTERLVNSCIEVHIITGAQDTPKIRKQLDDWGIKYHEFFSITDDLLNKGHEYIIHDTIEGTYWFDEHVWDKSKADYCYARYIDLHIDDTETYGEYFEKQNHFLLWQS